MIKKLIPLFFVCLLFAFGFIASPYLPDLMASHWGVDGQVNGYMSKNMGIYFIPCLSLFLYLLFLGLPYLEVYKKNFQEFQTHYYNFMIVIFAFFFYIYCLTLVWNLGYIFNMNQLLPPAFAVLFYFTGVLMSHAKRNWFVGIRTPWTMSSDRVWDKTHRVGALLFKWVAYTSLFGIFFPSLSFYFLFIPLIFTVVFIFVYSYLEYPKSK